VARSLHQFEVLGATTQFPFGDYDYSNKLGLALLGVPILIPVRFGDIEMLVT
jgi:uncharacterized membrane protein